MTETIDAPRLIEGMAAEAYHADPACSASKLKAMRPTPAHALHRINHPAESDALSLGSLFHAMALEPATLDRWAPVDCDRRYKAGKEAWADIQASGQTPVKVATWNESKAMLAACKSHPAWATLIEAPGRNELSVFWTDEETGQPCKARADRVVDVPGFGSVCVDLKTTADASPEGFSRAIHRYGYAIQAAWYLGGLAKAGIACDEFVVIAVESAAPYCVAAYSIDHDSIAQGERDCRRLVKLYRQCVQSGVWPGYSSRIESIGLPLWAVEDDEF